VAGATCAAAAATDCASRAETAKRLYGTDGTLLST
jgi:hypothetical protein